MTYTDKEYAERKKRFLESIRAGFRLVKENGLYWLKYEGGALIITDRQVSPDFIRRAKEDGTIKGSIPVITTGDWKKQSRSK